MPTYKTRQRDAILAYLAKNPGSTHTAREIIDNVPVGEATVFRTLKHLTEEGVLKRFSDGGTGSVYQYDGCHGDHLHLKCSGCGALFHLDCHFVEEIARHFSAEHGFSLDCSQTVLYGLCADCRGRDRV